MQHNTGMSSSPAAGPLCSVERTSDRVRALLKHCCRGDCIEQPGHACEQIQHRAHEAVRTPGAIEEVGPLSGPVQARLEAICRRPVGRNNAVQLLLDGTQSFSAMLELVQSAEEEILFENFIIRADAVGTVFAEELDRRADENIDVRILYDALGSIGNVRILARRFRTSRAAARAYNPLRPTLKFLRSGWDHRKLVVQDRRRLVAGGLCLGDVWLGNCITHCTWRDSAVIAEGEVAGEAAEEFDRMWQRSVRPAAYRAPESTKLPLDEDPAGDVPLRLITDEPGHRRVERTLAAVFSAARSEILITNQYFVPTPPVTEALLTALRGGVNVELLVPAHCSPAVVGLTSEHLVGPLLAEGLKMWHWKGPMIHAKTAVVDRCWSLVGSSNVDPLSFWRNAELNLEIHGSAVGEQMAGIFAEDRGRSTSFTYEDWRSRSLPRRWLTRLSSLGSSWQ